MKIIVKSIFPDEIQAQIEADVCDSENIAKGMREIYLDLRNAKLHIKNAELRGRLELEKEEKKETKER